MVPEGDDPVLGGGAEVRLQPVQHRASRRAAGGHRIERDEMDAAVVEGIVFFGAGGHAAGRAVGGMVEYLEVRNGQRRIGQLRRVVVADGRPEHRLAKIGRVHVEHGRLVFGIGAVLVGVVAEHQPDVGVAACAETGVTVAHRRRGRALGAGIAEHPDSGRLRVADQRRGHEGIVGAAGERCRRGSDRIVIAAGGRQPGQQHLMLGGERRVADDGTERRGAGAEAHAAVAGRVGPPTHDDAARRAHLEVRAARDRGGAGDTDGGARNQEDG